MKYRVTVTYEVTTTQRAEVEVEAQSATEAQALVREMDHFGGLNWRADNDARSTPYAWEMKDEAGNVYRA